MSNQASGLSLRCVIVCGMAAAASGEIIVKDDFPGYTEDPDWRSWDRGVGHTSYEPGPPDFDSSRFDDAEAVDTTSAASQPASKWKGVLCA